jgi:hypothetical protein
MTNELKYDSPQLDKWRGGLVGRWGKLAVC